MSKDKRNGQNNSFTGPTIKHAFGELLKAYHLGELDDLDSHVTITVRGGDLSPETKEALRNKPV
ncbi:MAG: hypothetical protein WCS88_04640 [Patescibacteria group bacterium]|jgi:hypothetical protein